MLLLATVTPEAGSIVANRFALIRELGRGSMGTVWLADHLTLDVRCAVKFMTGEATRDPAYVGRFELEARAIARLASPNVVRVLDYDVHEGMPFIAMECLQGEDLGARLQRVGRLDAETTHRIIAQVAHGLAKAHAAGIVHRDLKPDNIFLAQEDDQEIAKIVDFGIAKMTGFATAEGLSSSTQAGSLIGTPAYMSPEQARGVSDLDHRSDLWSLAVIAYECLTGHLPFESASLGDLFAKLLFEPLPVPSKLYPESASSKFDRWWARAAARPVEERFDSAPDLADALGRALGVGEVHTTLRALNVSGVPFSSRVMRPRKRASKFVVAAMAFAVAPLALMLSSGRIDARPRVAAGAIHAAEASAAAGMARGTAVVASTLAPASAETAVVARENVREQRRTITASTPVAPALARPTRGPVRPPQSPSSAPVGDDVDFGI